MAEADFGKDQVCPECRAVFKVVWAVDPRSGEKVARRISGIRVPAGSFEVRCSCGQPLVARREHSGRTVTCPVCRAPMTLEAYRDPQTLHTRIRRRGPVEATAVAATSLGNTTARRNAPPGGQDILCPCGEYLRVYEAHLDKQAMCPACGTLMKLERSKDPQTSATQVRPRIVGKGTPPPRPPDPPPGPARPDPDAWSLEDFQ